MRRPVSRAAMSERASSNNQGVVLCVLQAVMGQHHRTIPGLSSKFDSSITYGGHLFVAAKRLLPFHFLPLDICT